MIEFAVRRPVAVIMICVGLVALGLIAAKRIPVQLLPNIQTPEFTIITSFKGATPEEVEAMISAPIERAVSTVGGLERTTSMSERERSEIHLNFKPSINYLETISTLREKLDSAGLPEGASRPKVIRFQANSAPVVKLAIKPVDHGTPPLETVHLLQDILIRKLEQVEGVAITSLLGAPERRIQITVDPIAAQSFGIQLNAIPELIQTRNRSYPAGEIQFEGTRTSVKLGQGIKSLEDLKQTIVKKDGAKLIRLEDIASITEVIEKPIIRTHLQGEDALIIEVRKEAEANTVRVADLAKEVIQEFLREHKEKVQGWILFDQGRQIELAIDNVAESVFHGGVLAGLVIFVLIQNWWPTFVVSVSMPISILITFILMYFTGITFNLMSLAGLALGVGMLVDNSTVVLDNIHLLQSRMTDRKSAALWGTRTVVGAITGSTLATMAVFGPLAFVDGMIGQMFRDVAATVCYSLAASLFSAVFLIPMLSAIEISPTFKFKKGQRTTSENQFLKSWNQLTAQCFYEGSKATLVLDFFRKSFAIMHFIGTYLFIIAIDWLSARLAQPAAQFMKLGQFIGAKTLQPFLHTVSRWIQALESGLKRVIPEVIQDSRRTLRWAIGLTLAGCALLAWRGAELFPDEAADRIVYDLQFAPGQTVEVTEAKVIEIEKKMLGVRITSGHSSVSGAGGHGSVGGIPGLNALSSSIGEAGSHLARLTFQVDEKRSLEISKVIASRLSQFPGLTFNRAKESMMGDGKPVQIDVYNEDLNLLKEQLTLVQNEVSQIKGLTDIESTIKSDLSEIVIQFSKDRLGWYGLEANAFVSTLRPMLMGQSAGLLQFKGDELPVNVRLPASYFNSLEKVKYLSVPQEDDRRLYLSQVSDVSSHKILAGIKHINRKRVASLAANINGTDLESVSKKIKSSLDKSLTQQGLVWKMGGQDEERERSQKSLLLAVGLSIFLIYLMLAGQFENLTQPIIILCAVPLCISGVAVFLMLFNLNISALVFVGFIILIGVSVNTSIVMVDFANQLVSEGKSLQDAISEATVRRMRPILVTTLSGILGLVPMALAMGQGSAMQQPLAVTMIGGHLSSTVLTMLVVPIIYVRLAKAAKIGATEEK